VAYRQQGSPAGGAAALGCSGEARVVLLASMTHFDGQLQLSDLQWAARPYDPYRWAGLLSCRAALRRLDPSCSKQCDRPS
jgi:hypothetical protein